MSQIYYLTIACDEYTYFHISTLASSNYYIFFLKIIIIDINVYNHFLCLLLFSFRTLKQIVNIYKI